MNRNNFHMDQNFFTSVMRNILRQKSHAVINILGLSLGLAISLIIWMYVLHELSYDRFFTDHQKIYRVQNIVSAGMGDPEKIPTSMFYTAEFAQEELPEIESFVRFNSFFRSPALTFEDQTVYLNNILLSDSTFFSFFDFDFLEGSTGMSLSEANSMVLTRSTALLLFESPQDAFGKIVTFNDQSYLITGIIEDLPENTHLVFNGVIPHYHLAENLKSAGYNWYTYLKITPGSDIDAVTEKLDDVAINRVIGGNPLLKDLLGDETLSQKSHLIKLADIHLNSNLAWEMKSNGNKRDLWIIALISVFILLVAIINFVNLATARSSLRAKEIGVRKMAGASRGNLIRRFISESFVVTFLAFVVALGLAEIFGGYFSRNFGITIDTLMLFSPQGIIVIFLIFLITGFLSGIYPAFYLSSFEPVRTLKGDMVKGTGGQGFRRLLVVFQFTITIALLSALWIVGSQLRHLQKQSMGVDKEQVMVVQNVSHRISRNFQALCSQLESRNRIEKTAGANFLFGGHSRIDVIVQEGAPLREGIVADIITIDHDFLDLMGISLVNGRKFYADSEMDVQSAFIINQTALNALGYDDPLHTNLDLFGIKGPLVGIVQDFHIRSLHNRIEPLVFLYAREGFPHIYVKVNPGNMKEAREQIIEVLNEVDPAYIPDIVFLDDTIQAFYEKEEQTSGMLVISTLLAIVIAMLGVYGLAAFSAERRIKEIGIRKVLGASIEGLLWVFNRESMVLFAIAFVIAAPITWLVMESWLNNFWMRIQIQPFWFLIPGLVILIISTLIISIQTWLTSNANPVQSLRSE